MTINDAAQQQIKSKHNKMKDKKIKITILILLVIAGIIEGCKKYEDGPLVSFRSAENRIFGKHTLIKYTVDGIDSLSLYNDSLGLSFNFNYDEVSKENICSIDGKRKDGKYGSLSWNWKLANNNKILQQIYSIGSIGTGPFGKLKNNIEWEILRLTNKELKMKTNYNNKEYLIELIK